MMNIKQESGRKLTLEERKAVGLNMLIDFDKICKENNITYYLYAGTALGAIRHKGFIPWDDDVDILIWNKDREKLLNILSKEKKYNLITEDNVGTLFFSKICDTRTVMIHENEKNRKKLGVWIDIFELNNLGDTEKECKNFMKKCYRHYRIYNLFGVKKKYYSSDNAFKSIIYAIILFPLYVYFKVRNIEKYKKKCIKYMRSKNNRSTKFVGVNCSTCNHDDYEKKWFENTEYVNFEGHRFPIMSGYKEYLGHRYGDYMKLPPENARIPHNGLFYWR